MPVLLVLLAAMVVELVVVVTVGQAIGLLPTIGLLLLASLLGVALLRREGSRTLAAFGDAARTRRAPQREVADGVLLAAAAVLIVLPGFVSDIAGLLLLLPPTRALVRGRMVRAAERRVLHLGPLPGRPLRFAPGDVVDGSVVTVDPDVDPDDSGGRALGSPEPRR